MLLQKLVKYWNHPVEFKTFWKLSSNHCCLSRHLSPPKSIIVYFNKINRQSFKFQSYTKLENDNLSGVYPERVSALDFKDTATPRSGHTEVFDLFIETRISHLITLLLNFSKLFLTF